MRRWLATSLVAMLAGLAACSAVQPGAQTASETGAAANGTQLAAESGNPGFIAPAAGPAAEMPGDVDLLFVRQAAVGGMAEVQFGELAAEKGSNDRVTAFGRRMIREHGAANQDLEAVAADKGIQLPAGLDGDLRRQYDALTTLSGAEFDTAYIHGQIQGHQRTVQLLEHEIGSGQDAAIKRFARERLPTALDHLEMAKQVAAELATTASR